MSKKTLILLGAVLAVVPCSCGKNEESDEPARSEYIKVYETSPQKTVDNIQVPFEGAQDAKIHVLSNVPLQWKYFINPGEPDLDWLTIKSVEEVEQGHTIVTYDAKSLLPLNALDRRAGQLSFSSPEHSLGKFLTVRQGYSQKFYEDFSDEAGGNVTITGNQTFTTQEYPVLNSDYFDYISFNAWAESENEYLNRNITVDVTVSGGIFHATGLTTYRVNVPLGTGADQDNLKYLLLMGNGERMSAKTTFTFSVANDELVYVHIDNLAAYLVNEAEMGELFEDEDFNEDEEPDWV
ncbi:MAG: hypothetical protein K6F58_00935 [Bacteroidales bacterium]|nr:hypothetical protein [Bacteroidales bacterium]